LLPESTISNIGSLSCCLISCLILPPSIIKSSHSSHLVIRWIRLREFTSSLGSTAREDYISRWTVFQASQLISSYILTDGFVAEFRFYWKASLTRETGLDIVVLWLRIRARGQRPRSLYWSCWVGTTVPSICLFLLSHRRGNDVKRENLKES
jgi:hypothetical protein